MSDPQDPSDPFDPDEDPSAEQPSAERPGDAFELEELLRPVRRDDEPGMDDAISQLLEVLERVPFVAGFKRDLHSLRDLVARRRAPRILTMGSPWVGRSQLLNALVGSPLLRVGLPATGRWRELEEDGRKIEWLELDVPVDGDAELAQAKRDYLFAVDERDPDIVLVCATPAEVEGGIGRLLEALTFALGQRRNPTRDTPAPKVIGALLQSDTTVPGASSAAGLTDEQRAAIEVVRKRFVRQLDEASFSEVPVFALSTPTPAEQRRDAGSWGLEPLVGELARSFPAPARVEAARVLPYSVGMRRRIARDVIQACSTLSVTVALAPIPLSDLAVLAPLQAIMVSSVAYISGRRWDRRASAEFLGSVGVVGGAGLGFRWGAQQVVKLVPGAGSVVSAGIAGAGTLALGRSALAYYLPSPPPAGTPRRPPLLPRLKKSARAELASEADASAEVASDPSAEPSPESPPDTE